MPRRPCSAARSPRRSCGPPVGGPGLIAQMRALDATRVDELVRGLPRPQRAAARAARAVRRHRGRAASCCATEGRRLGIVTAKRQRHRPARLRRPAALEALLRRRRRRRRHRAPQAASRADPARARAARRGARPRRRTSATRRSTSPAAKAAGRRRDRRHLGRHPLARAARARSSPTRSSTPRRSCLASSEDGHARRPSCARCSTTTATATTSSTSPEVSDAEYDRLFDELVELERELPDGEIPADSPTRRVGAPPSERFLKVDHLSPMGSLDKVTTDEAVAQVGGRRAQAPRHGRAGRLRDRAEDRRARRSASSTRTASSSAARRAATASAART